MSNIRLEVRCCCQPTKLLGWVTIPLRDVERRRFVRVVDLIDPTARKFGVAAIAAQLKRIDLPIDGFRTSRIINDGMQIVKKHSEYLAVKAEGVPIEDLRLLREFEEFTPDSVPGRGTTQDCLS